MNHVYVTLSTSDFLPGVVALHNTLKRHTSIPLVVMCQDVPIHERRELIKMGLGVIKVDPIPNPYTAPKQGNADRFLHTYTKLRAFSLTQFDRIVFLDSDCLVLKPIDDLFEREGFWAAPDYGITLNHKKFNSGVFVVEPKHSLFDDMMQKIDTTRSDDNSDQGFLNKYYSSRWNCLDYTYNTLKRVYRHQKKLWRPSEIKVLHMVGRKPWFRGKHSEGELYHKLNVLWEKCKRGEECTL